MGISRGMGIREISESRQVSGNSHTENSREGKVQSHTGKRELEFPVGYPWFELKGQDSFRHLHMRQIDDVVTN